MNWDVENTMKTKHNTINHLTLAYAPPIPGLSFRLFQGEEDYRHILQVFDQCKHLDAVDYTMTIESIRHHYAHLERSDPYQDLIFVEVEDQVIGYGRVGWYPETSGDRIYYSLGWILPSWRQKGIGRAMLRYFEARLRQIAADHPQACLKYFQAEHNDRQTGLGALLEESGYEIVRWGYEMVRPIYQPLPEVSLPADLEVRPVPEERYRDVFQAQNEAFRDHWGHVEATEEDFLRFLSDPTFKPELWKVAWDGDTVAGMVLNFVNDKENQEYRRKRGYTENISVRRPYRRRGVARYLLVQSIRMFREMGMEETALGVDAQNPNQALRLYEGVGYKTYRTYLTSRKPLET